MRKILMVCGVLVAVLSLASGAMAHCGSCDHGKAEAAKAEGTESCPFSAAKAVYEKTLNETGCEKTAKSAYNKAVAEGSYAKALAESGCSKTAAKAAYENVLKECGCKKTAAAAAQHAVAKASYDETLEKTGCEKTAQKAYDETLAKAVATDEGKSESSETETSAS
jgi:hypothetical protein